MCDEDLNNYLNQQAEAEKRWEKKKAYWVDVYRHDPDVLMESFSESMANQSSDTYKELLAAIRNEDALEVYEFVKRNFHDYADDLAEYKASNGGAE